MATAAGRRTGFGLLACRALLGKRLYDRSSAGFRRRTVRGGRGRPDPLGSVCRQSCFASRPGKTRLRSRWRIVAVLQSAWRGIPSYRYGADPREVSVRRSITRALSTCRLRGLKEWRELAHQSRPEKSLRIRRRGLIHQLPAFDQDAGVLKRTLKVGARQQGLPEKCIAEIRPVPFRRATERGVGGIRGSQDNGIG